MNHFSVEKLFAYKNKYQMKIVLNWAHHATIETGELAFGWNVMMIVATNVTVWC